MFNLGFTMEELMFPENCQTKFFKHESDEIFSLNDDQEQIMIDDEDDWFTVQQLNSGLDLSSCDSYMNINRTVSFEQYPSMIESLFVPNLSIRITNEKIGSTDNMSSSSFNQHQTKSTSSLSICTQSSTSMTSSSTDEISRNSNDFNDQSTEYTHEPSYYHKYNLSNSSRRRRKRTIFTANDIEHLKEAFIQNPKPNQQDIALLSEQLGYDSYVIRVWFYNKRQASKKGD